MVGDDDQCILQGMLVNTPDGSIPIEQLLEGQRVYSPSGWGNVLEGIVEKKIEKEYSGPIVKIKTQKGNVIKTTPNHIMFGKLNVQPGVYYVYLMYKKGKGYRIGQTQGVRSREGEIINGLMVRLNQEHGDKAWILKICNSKEETVFYEQLYSFKYGIPTTVFHNVGRGISLTQNYIDELFSEIDTESNAIKLMNDLLIFEEFPHHRPNAIISGGTIRRLVNLTFFGGRITGADKGWHSHRIAFNTSNDELEEKARRAGFPVRKGQRNTWRIETERIYYDETNVYGKSIQELDNGIEIVRRARLTEDESFYYMPASHIKPSMSIAAFQDGKIIEDIVEEVSIEEYDGYVYDISVPNFRQYLCQGIAVHNSIYGWRGADIRNILDFEKDYSNAEVIKLEQNYRSTKTILNAANQVIENNEGRKSKRLWTANDEGCLIKIFSGANEHEEANFIVDKIKEVSEKEDKKLSDFAILYRTNAQSRVIEEAFLKANIPYKIVGGHKFYDRKEIKDIIAYLRLIQNPVDNYAFKRIVNVPKRGLGKTTLDRLEQYSIKKEDSIFGAMLECDEIPGLTPRAKDSLNSFSLLIRKFMAMKELFTVTELIENIIDSIGYIEEIQQEETVQAESRIENIKEFLSVAVNFEETSEDKTLEGFLANISLLSDLDKTDENDRDTVTMMTLHSAKGLEFPVVFMTGMEESLFPTSRAYFSEDDMEEERRLCYVGITRAEEMLFMTRAFSRMLYGKTGVNSMSRFLREVPDEFIEDLNESEASTVSTIPTKINVNTSSKYFAGYTVENTRKAPVVSNLDVKPGTKVNHKAWGIGTVVQVKDLDNDKELIIAFNSQGIKKLMLSFAPIEIL
ncbi:3'-5' exonuclease [Proteiniborus sp. MB09-C3]|uniref:3'-5' exonuclease n=1 Tax=Proteiniborus sp. MB09-C3 TaxID=3050072 RepID=UPI0033219B4C